MNIRLKYLVFLLIVLCSPSYMYAKSMEDVTLQLRWTHQFQFAGYYMAAHKGYYRDAGLNVTIKEANKEHSSPVEEVLSGRVQYGIGNSGLINERNNGKPIVVLASIFQISPNVWILRKDSGVDNIIDLAKKRLMMTNNVENAELLALFHNEGINYKKLTVIGSSFDINDLIDNKVDAFNGYSTNEPYYLKEKGIDYSIIYPRKYGIDFYSDCLFTSKNEVSEHPDRVKAFREASLKGWAYAMAHKEETIDVILLNYTQLKTRDHLRFEADAIHELMKPEMIEIGHMNPARWEKIAKTYHTLGFSKDDFVPEGFLYNPYKLEDNSFLYYLLFTVSSLLIIIGAVAYYIYRLNCKIKEQSIKDSLTGLYNRRYLSEILPKEMERTIRESEPLSIIMIDLDNFKQINDTYGHVAGDEVLKQMADSFLKSIRVNDFVCRYGGEEFIIILPGMSIEQAYERIEACRIRIGQTKINYNDQEISVTISAGISMFPQDAKTQDQLLKAADDALYYSKEHGRNQITIAKNI